MLLFVPSSECFQCFICLFAVFWILPVFWLVDFCLCPFLDLFAFLYWRLVWTQSALSPVSGSGSSFPSSCSLCRITKTRFQLNLVANDLFLVSVDVQPVLTLNGSNTAAWSVVREASGDSYPSGVNCEKRVRRCSGWLVGSKTRLYCRTSQLKCESSFVLN